MVITMAKLLMAHASKHGARNPPVPMFVTDSMLGFETISKLAGQKQELEPRLNDAL